MKDVRNLSAEEAMKIRKDEAVTLSKSINHVLTEMSKTKYPFSIDWGHVGSASHVVEILEELASFIGADIPK